MPTALIANQFLSLIVMNFEPQTRIMIRAYLCGKLFIYLTVVVVGIFANINVFLK